MFNEVIHIPLMLLGCCVKPGIYKYNVSTIDIAPMLLDLLGIEYNSRIFEGNNLFNKPLEERVIITEDIAYGYDKLALISDDTKYLFSPGDNIYWKFDLKTDSYEKKPIFLGDQEVKNISDLIRFKSILKPKLSNFTALGKIKNRNVV